METLLKTLLIILLVWYGGKFLFRLAAPFVLKYIQKKMGQKFEQAFGNMQQPHNQQEEGEVTIEKAPSKNTKRSNVVGEYVDFEELE